MKNIHIELYLSLTKSKLQNCYENLLPNNFHKEKKIKK